MSIEREDKDIKHEMATVKDEEQASPIEPALEARVRRKIDRVILPLLAMTFFFQYLDKQSIGYAAVFGLIPDLRLTSSEYSWAISLFYFGQFVFEYPFIYLLSRLNIAKFVGVMIIVWGGVEACLAAPKGFPGFAAVRFLLGACEGAVSPAFVMITSNWYTRREHPIRVATWISFNSVAQIIGATMMYGVGLADDMLLENWRVMFLICGGGTMCAGIIWLTFMPSGPSTAWFLTEEERDIAVRRLAADHISREQTNFKKSQMWEALKDYRSWMFFIFAFLDTMPSPVIKFASLVINGFGFNKFQTMLVSLPAGAIQICTIWTAVLGIHYTKIPRCYWGILVTVVPLTGNLLLINLPNSAAWGIVVGAWMATVLSPTMVVVLSLMASNIKGNTKKSTVSNMYFIAYSVGCIVSPQLWSTNESPRFKRGVTCNVICICLLIVAFISYRFLTVLENKKKEKLIQGQPIEDFGDEDVTDKQDKKFMYVS